MQSERDSSFPQRPGLAASRPLSAGSTASSASSFRIPGIAPSSRIQPFQGQPQRLGDSVQLPAASTSIARLFTPQRDDHPPLFRTQSRGSTAPSLDWLPKNGPDPRELLESSQAIPQGEPVPESFRRLATPSFAKAGRPTTSQTENEHRPFTASSYHRSKIMTADGLSGNYICAILENRGIGREVGVASIERETGLCIITQFADTPTYVRTIHHLSLYPPSILLVPSSGTSGGQGASSASRASKRARIHDGGQHGTSHDIEANRSQKGGASMLIRCIEEMFEISATPFHRRHWNYQEGEHPSFLLSKAVERAPITIWGSPAEELTQPEQFAYIHINAGARYLDRLLVDDVDEIKETEEGVLPDASQVRTQQSQRPVSSRPQTGFNSLDMDAKASTRAAILVAVAEKYYLLSAVAGLFDFFTETFNRIFTPKSLQIRFVVPEGTILINSNTAHDLELVRNLIDPRSKDSLYGLLDRCATPMGRRLLKMNILQPLASVDTIAARQDAVAECIRNEEQFYAIRESLKPLQNGSIDLDKLIHALSYKERNPSNARTVTERKIGSILNLRTLLRSLAPGKNFDKAFIDGSSDLEAADLIDIVRSVARAALQNSTSGLLQSIHQFLDSENVGAISEAIQNTIDEDIAFAKGGVSSRNAKMYAVRAERSPLLDVARATYNENLGDISELCEREKRETGLNITLKMVQNGFLFQTKCESSQMGTLTERYTNISRSQSGKGVTMMTLALKKINARLAESMSEVCKLSESIIDELIDGIIDKVASLYNVSEALSLLDMIVSFAQVSIANDYVRPAFGPTLDIRNARHPILDRVDIPNQGPPGTNLRRRQSFVPNDIYLAPGERVCLVTGPNMSGKSTLLRQVALITVLAGLGCWVPATRATLPIPDALLSLLTHEDDATQNLSTFASEMRTSAFILSVATPKSLVILDEMGRGTSPEEGCAIATAVIEEMLNEKGSTVFFATHFGEIVDGLDGKEGVVCQHLEVSTRQQNTDVGLVFHHRLHLGPGLNTHYSLQVAKMMGCFSDNFLQHAQSIAVVERSAQISASTVLNRDTKERRKRLRGLVRDVRRLAQGQLEEELGDQENATGHGMQPLIERLSLLQLHATNEIEATFKDEERSIV